MVFGLPFALPMLAMGQDTKAGLPACCRRNGMHHCMMSMDERGKLVVNHDPQFKTPVEKCSYCPGSVASSQPNPLAAPTLAGTLSGELVSHPTGIAQTDARGRVSRDRSHQKRGPPALTDL